MHATVHQTRWLACPRPDPAASLRLWCLPFAGGGAAVWHPWASQLTGVAEVVAIRLPGRENRHEEPAFKRLTALLPELVDLIAPYSDEPYALCGHSLGGLVAYELACALRSRGIEPPQALIVSGARAPQHRADLPWLHAMPNPGFLREIERRYGTFPGEIRGTDVFELLLPSLRADLEVYETYEFVPNEPLDLPLLALSGAADANVSRLQLLGWCDYTTGPFASAIVAGGHFFPHENVAGTTAVVRGFLRRHVIGPLVARAATRGLDAEFDPGMIYEPNPHRLTA